MLDAEARREISEEEVNSTVSMAIATIRAANALLIAAAVFSEMDRQFSLEATERYYRRYGDAVQAFMTEQFADEHNPGKHYITEPG